MKRIAKLVIKETTISDIIVSFLHVRLESVFSIALFEHINRLLQTTQLHTQKPALLRG